VRDSLRLKHPVSPLKKNSSQTSLIHLPQIFIFQVDYQIDKMRADPLMDADLAAIGVVQRWTASG
jgi:hypothetical protein